ncbi:MAG TPA: Hsp20/alpha crystallin family protein [Chloroflexota bacterium]|nr:Hsp20/alpha crystallin family protein [Chloroflexota bacterium]
MAIDRWDPFREALSLRDAMDWLMRESFIRPDWFAGARGGGWLPMDVEERQDDYVLRASLAGWKPEEIDVSIQGDTVTISGHRKPEEREEKDKTYHLRERGFAAFTRSFTFPGAVDASRAAASFENGELILTIPKSEEAKPRRIQIKSAGTPLPGGQPT